MRDRNVSNLETLGQEQPPRRTQTGDRVHAELQRRASENGSDRKTLLTFSLGKQTPKSDQNKEMCDMTNHLQNTSQAGSMWQRTHREKGSALQAMFQNQREAQKEGEKKREYLKISSFQMQKFSPSDVMTDEDFFVLSQIEQIQPSSNFLCAPILNYQS